MKTIITSCKFPKVNDIKDRVKQNREKFESRRALTQKRLQGDVGKIAKEEIEFSKSLFKQMIPVEVKVSVDKNAEGFKKMIPISFKIIGLEDFYVAPTPEKDTNKEKDTEDVKREAEKQIVESSVDAYLVDGERERESD